MSNMEDFARVEIETPFDAEWLEQFISDPQRVLRINSQKEFSSFEREKENRWHMAGSNLISKQDFDSSFEFEASKTMARLIYDDGLKTSTQLLIEDQGDGTAKLIIIEDYSGVDEDERRQRIDEVDNTIVQWGRDIHRYLYQWKRWSWVPGWKLYMRKFWQKMKPSARRISFMLLIITVLEFIGFLFVFTIYWLEHS